MEEKLLELLYGDEGLDYEAKKKLALAEQARGEAPVTGLDSPIPGANPEVPTGADALVGALMSMGGIPPEIARGGAPSVRPPGNRPRPNWILGFPNEGKESKPFTKQKYRFELPVKVTWPDGSSHTDVVKGLNASHALKRAQFNWEGATVEPVSK
jgi:hypothetical protein